LGFCFYTSKSLNAIGMASKIFAVVGILLFVFVCLAMPIVDYQESNFIETQNVMVFGDSGQGEIPNYNTGEMVVVVDG